MARAGGGAHQVVEEGVERIGQGTVPVDEVQYLVHQHQHRAAGGGEQPGERFGARRAGARGVAEGGDPGLAAKLPGEIEPRRLPRAARIPRVADEHAEPGAGDCWQVFVREQVRHARELCGLRAEASEVPERGQRVGLAAAELGDEGQHRRRAIGLAGEAAQHGADLLAHRGGEIGAGEELVGVAIVGWRGAGDHLFQRDGEFVRVEGPAFTHLATRGGGAVPGVHHPLILLRDWPRTDANAGILDQYDRACVQRLGRLGQGDGYSLPHMRQTNRT